MGWVTLPLGEALTFQRGFDITKAQQQTGPYWVISSSGPNSQHDDYKVKGPGVVIGRKGSLGTVFFTDQHYWPHDTTLWVKDFHGNDPRFAYYFLHTMGFEKLDVGASNPTLNRNHIHVIPVRWPEEQIEQRRIASILSAYDDLIENNMRRIAILEEMARRIYEEWFVRFRFPGHEQVKMVESELGLIPEGWIIGNVNTVARLLSGYAFKSSDFTDEGIYPLVTIRNVHGGVFIADCTNRLAERPARMPKYCELNEGDILLSLTGNVGRCCLVTGNGYLLNQRVAKVQPLNEVDQAYCYCLFRSNVTQESLIRLSNGVAQQNLSPVETGKMGVPLPPVLIRSQFNSVVTPMLHLMISLWRKNTNLRTTRDLLLPKLISGELDVSTLPEAEALST